MVVVVPPNAELEPGFSHWYQKLVSIAKEGGMSICMYAAPKTLVELENQGKINSNSLKTEYKSFSNWEDFLVFSGELETNDLFVIVSSRKGHVSYINQLDKLPYYLSNYFKNNSFLLLYPAQTEHGLMMDKLDHVDSSLIETIASVGNLFKKKN